MLCIRKCMVHAVEDAIYSRTHIRRALGDIRIDIKKFLPSLAHGKGPVSGITVMKKRLGKKGKVPVCYKKYKNCYHERKWVYKVKAGKQFPALKITVALFS